MHTGDSQWITGTEARQKGHSFPQQQTSPVTFIESAQLPTKHGTYQVHAYTDQQNREHLALTFGDLQTEAPLVRLHSQCVTGDLSVLLLLFCKIWALRPFG